MRPVKWEPTLFIDTENLAQPHRSMEAAFQLKNGHDFSYFSTKIHVGSLEVHH